MLKLRLSENCHLRNRWSLYFCSTMKYKLTFLLLLICFMSCNDGDQAKQKTETPVQVSNREQVLKDSILKFPDSLILKEQLIQYYRDSFYYDKAIATVNHALQKDSLNDRLWDIKATLYYENDDTANAIRAYETALQLKPDPNYVKSLGSLYAQTKNARALQMADLLLQTNKEEAQKDAFFIEGLYYNYTGEKNKAIGFFDKCLNMDYTYMIAYREKGIALYDMGRYQDAVTVLDKAVTLQNRFDEGYYWLGRCLEKLNKPADAIEEYRTALMYSPDYTEAKQALTRLGAQ